MGMKTLNNTFEVIFYLGRYKINQDGTIPIYLRITVNGSRLDISAKRNVAKKTGTLEREWPKGAVRKS
jgi:hypothetical protein